MASVLKSAALIRSVANRNYGLLRGKLISNTGKRNSYPALGGLSSVVHCRNYSDTYFTKKHEYIVLESESVGRVGISDYAQDKLGDVVYVQLPEVGRDIEKDEEVAAVESVKAASEIYSPVSGHITEVNEVLESDCALINKSAMDKGWIYRLTLSHQDELQNLMNEHDYQKYLQQEAENE